MFWSTHYLIFFSFTFPGVHVVVTMFTGYLLGYAAFRALFNHSPAMVLSKICFSLSLLSISVLVLSSHHLLIPFFPSFLSSCVVSISRMLLEEFWGWLVPCLLKLSFSLLEVQMQKPTEQKNSVKNQDRPFQHPVLLRKISRSIRLVILQF